MTRDNLYTWAAHPILTCFISTARPRPERPQGPEPKQLCWQPTKVTDSQLPRKSMGFPLSGWGMHCTMLYGHNLEHHLWTNRVILPSLKMPPTRNTQRLHVRYSWTTPYQPGWTFLAETGRRLPSISVPVCESAVQVLNFSRTSAKISSNLMESRKRIPQ